MKLPAQSAREEGEPLKCGREETGERPAPPVAELPEGTLGVWALMI